MEAQLFGALTSARLSRKIGQKVYFFNLKKSGRIPDDMDLKGFEEDIASDGDIPTGPDGDDETDPVVPDEKDDGKATA
jgi:hypothetical protein